ncbi:MAG: diguanylate cyclase [Candidatus Auribacterota bacterium]|jgi:diguanylate cyclase (GGDEF)-like protein|uniref:diguanylate cyclase n=1 Tax=Candidatus Auribacter fodinae TaxID=2093366 RepID=A0A3A4R4T3_9BACT|nr:MAG: diguanylate cyclase [Candidatus Auribacter fodinae]
MPKILVVDDDHGLVDMLQIGLEALQYETLVAYDGVEAVAKTKEHMPDIILLDVNLPLKTGFEVCKEIRSTVLTTYIPIIMITARDDLSSKIEGLDIGADDYITKPVDIKEVLARIKSMLRIKKLQDELRTTRDELRELSIKDYLTGCYNRRYIMEILLLEVKKSRRYGLSLACIMADLDGFKAVNDTYGHPFGDVVLKSIAEVIFHNLRDSDIIGRYGGEEFIAILPSLSQKAELEDICERIRSAVEQKKCSSNGCSVNVTISIGATLFNGVDIPDEDKIIEIVDEALYEAKHSGKNCFVLR